MLSTGSSFSGSLYRPAGPSTSSNSLPLRDGTYLRDARHALNSMSQHVYGGRYAILRSPPSSVRERLQRESEFLSNRLVEEEVTRHSGPLRVADLDKPLPPPSRPTTYVDVATTAQAVRPQVVKVTKTHSNRPSREASLSRPRPLRVLKPDVASSPRVEPKENGHYYDTVADILDEYHEEALDRVLVELPIPETPRGQKSRTLSSAVPLLRRSAVSTSADVQSVAVPTVSHASTSTDGDFEPPSSWSRGRRGAISGAADEFPAVVQPISHASPYTSWDVPGQNSSRRRRGAVSQLEDQSPSIVQPSQEPKSYAQIFFDELHFGTSPSRTPTSGVPACTRGRLDSSISTISYVLNDHGVLGTKIGSTLRVANPTPTQSVFSPELVDSSNRDSVSPPALHTVQDPQSHDNVRDLTHRRNRDSVVSIATVFGNSARIVRPLLPSRAAHVAYWLKEFIGERVERGFERVRSLRKAKSLRKTARNLKKPLVKDT